MVAGGLAGGYAAATALLDRPGAEEGAEDGASEGGGGGERAAPVTAAAPEAREVTESFETVGTVLARRSIELRPPAEGEVVEVAQASGARVEAGDLIFRLDDRSERAAVDRARATVAETRSDFERNQELQGSNVVSEANLEASRAAYERAQAELRQAENLLDDRTVEAPFEGVLGLLDLDPGERVDPSTVVTTLDDIASVHVEFAAPERLYAAVEPGQAVTLASASYEDRVFEGRVEVVAPRIDEATRGFDARARVPNEEGRLVPGMFLSVSLILDRREALTVPEEAVITEGAETYVFVVEDGAARRRPVALGERVDGRVEAEGLDAGARVVTSGYGSLADGDPVRVAEGDGPGAADAQEGAQAEARGIEARDGAQSGAQAGAEGASAVAGRAP